MLVEYAARRMVTAISSVMFSRALRITSKETGSIFEFNWRLAAGDLFMAASCPIFLS
jgi:hypothetical protein